MSVSSNYCLEFNSASFLSERKKRRSKRKRCEDKQMSPLRVAKFDAAPDPHPNNMAYSSNDVWASETTSLPSKKKKKKSKRERHEDELTSLSGLANFDVAPDPQVDEMVKSSNDLVAYEYSFNSSSQKNKKSKCGRHEDQLTCPSGSVKFDAAPDLHPVKLAHSSNDVWACESTSIPSRRKKKKSKRERHEDELTCPSSFPKLLAEHDPHLDEMAHSCNNHRASITTSPMSERKNKKSKRERHEGELTSPSGLAKFNPAPNPHKNKMAHSSNDVWASESTSITSKKKQKKSKRGGDDGEQTSLSSLAKLVSTPDSHPGELAYSSNDVWASESTSIPSKKKKKKSKRGGDDDEQTSLSSLAKLVSAPDSHPGELAYSSNDVWASESTSIPSKKKKKKSKRERHEDELMCPSSIAKLFAAPDTLPEEMAQSSNNAWASETTPLLSERRKQKMKLKRDIHEDRLTSPSSLVKLDAESDPHPDRMAYPSNDLLSSETTSILSKKKKKKSKHERHEDQLTSPSGLVKFDAAPDSHPVELAHSSNDLWSSETTSFSSKRKKKKSKRERHEDETTSPSGLAKFDAAPDPHLDEMAHSSNDLWASKSTSITSERKKKKLKRERHEDELTLSQSSEIAKAGTDPHQEDMSVPSNDLLGSESACLLSEIKKKKLRDKIYPCIREEECSSPPQFENFGAGPDLHSDVYSEASNNFFGSESTVIPSERKRKKLKRERREDHENGPNPDGVYLPSVPYHDLLVSDSTAIVSETKKKLKPKRPQDELTSPSTLAMFDAEPDPHPGGIGQSLNGLRTPETTSLPSERKKKKSKRERPEDELTSLSSPANFDAQPDPHPDEIGQSFNDLFAFETSFISPARTEKTSKRERREEELASPLSYLTYREPSDAHLDEMALASNDVLASESTSVSSVPLDTKSKREGGLSSPSSPTMPGQKSETPADEVALSSIEPAPILSISIDEKSKREEELMPPSTPAMVGLTPDGKDHPSSDSLLPFESMSISAERKKTRKLYPGLGSSELFDLPPSVGPKAEPSHSCLPSVLDGLIETHQRSNSTRKPLLEDRKIPVVNLIYREGHFAGHALRLVKSFDCNVTKETGCELPWSDPSETLQRNGFRYAVRVVRFVQRNAGSISKLNLQFQSWQFATLTATQIAIVRKQFPLFKSGKFHYEEDLLLCRNLGQLLRGLDCDEKKAEELLQEFSSMKKVPGIMTAMLFFGAFVGRGLLQYRRCLDVCRRVLHLQRMSARYSVLEDPELRSKIMAKFPPDAKPRWQKALTELRLDMSLPRADLRKIVNTQKQSPVDLNKGRFSLQESQTLLASILQQRGTTDFLRVQADQIDWEALASSMKRSKASLLAHYSTVILPALRSEGYQHRDPLDWKEQLLMAILQVEPLRSHKDIPWKQLAQKQPGITTHKMRNFIHMSVIFPCSHEADNPSNSYRGAVQAALDKIQDLKSNDETFKRSVNNFGRETTRAKQIWSFYRDLAEDDALDHLEHVSSRLRDCD